MPRSGTTLIEQILSSHKNVYGAGELVILDQFMKKNINNNNFISLFENHSADNDEKISKDFQYNHMITLGFGRSPYWSISLTIESSSTYEYGPQLASIPNPLEKFMGNFMDIENKWIALDIMVNINENTRLDIMYGTLRGGIICSNGICRYVEPFDDGFKLNLTSVF